jgi:hypothetical protein
MEGEGQDNLICDRTPPSHIQSYLLPFQSVSSPLRLSPTGELTGDRLLII